MSAPSLRSGRNCHCGIIPLANAPSLPAKETIAVSMTHKAYAFDWSAFARDELHDILLDALSSGVTNALIRYIDANRYHLKNGDEGGPLSDNWNWKNELENFDVQEFGDLALTRFYDPMEDYGLVYDWSGSRRQRRSLRRLAGRRKSDRPSIRRFGCPRILRR